MAFGKYQWNNQELKKKATRYDNVMLAIAAVALVAAYLLKTYFTIIGILAIIGAGAMVYLSQKTQSQDKKLKAAPNVRPQQSPSP